MREEEHPQFPKMPEMLQCCQEPFNMLKHIYLVAGGAMTWRCHFYVF